jgi:hypothetical protein
MTIITKLRIVGLFQLGDMVGKEDTEELLDLLAVQPVHVVHKELKNVQIKNRERSNHMYSLEIIPH